MTTNFVNPDIVRDADRLAAEFREAQPFRHIVIENFFTPEACATLLRKMR